MLDLFDGATSNPFTYKTWSTTYGEKGIAGMAFTPRRQALAPKELDDFIVLWQMEHPLRRAVKDLT